MLSHREYEVLADYDLGHLRHQGMVRYQNPGESTPVLHAQGCSFLLSDAIEVTITLGEVSAATTCLCWNRRTSPLWWEMENLGIYFARQARKLENVSFLEVSSLDNLHDAGDTLAFLQGLELRPAPVGSLFEGVHHLFEEKRLAKITLIQEFLAARGLPLVHAWLATSLAYQGPLTSEDVLAGDWDMASSWDILLRIGADPEARTEGMLSHYEEKCQEAGVMPTPEGRNSVLLAAHALEDSYQKAFDAVSGDTPELAVIAAAARFCSRESILASLETVTLARGDLSRLVLAPPALLDRFVALGGMTLQRLEVPNHQDVPWEIVRGLWTDTDDNALYEPRKLLSAACSV